MKYYDNKLWQYVTRVPRSAVEERFNYGVKLLVMSTESNLITSTSCELVMWATRALRGMAEVRFNCGKIYRVYDRMSVPRYACGSLVLYN